MTVFIFIAILITLVLVHEFGHFLSAKFFGIRVQEFGVGFPPRIKGIKRGETLYSLNWLPFGGFVKIFGEEGEKADDPRSYASRPLWQRGIVLGAGIFLNTIFAFLILWFGFSSGLPVALGEEQITGKIKEQYVQIVNVAKGSPADSAGIERGDVIYKIQDTRYKIQKDITNVAALQTFTDEHRDEQLILTIKRGDEVFEKEVLARETPPEGEGPLGIVLAQIGIVEYPWYQAFGKALKATFFTVWLTLSGIFLFLKSIFVGGKVIGDVAGPVGIAVIVGQVYTLGLPYLLSFIALISLNLAVINLLPIPALDGGRLFFIGIEKLRGMPLKPETENKIHALGFAFLVSLIILVTIKDILAL